MRARFRMSALLAVATLAGGVALVPAGASADTTVALVNVAVPGPVGGSLTCLSTIPKCITAPGITNLTVTASAILSSTALPVITLTGAPGCSGQVSVGAVVTPGLASGVVSITVQYELTNAQGDVVPDSQTTIIKTLPFSAGTPPVTVTECATVLGPTPVSLLAPA